MRRTCGCAPSKATTIDGVQSRRASGRSIGRLALATVRLMSPGKLTRLEVLRDLDQRRLTTAARPPCIETPGAGAERRDVKNPAHHRHVFQEMELLIAVGEICMRNQGGGDAPYRQHQPDWTGEQPQQD